MGNNDALEKNWGTIVDSIEDWITIIDLDSTILKSNCSVKKHFHTDLDQTIGTRCCKLIHGTDYPVDGCPLPRMLETKQRASREVQIRDGRWMLITTDPIFNPRGEILKAIHITRDITGQITARIEKEHLLTNLKTALDRVKILSGLIPICSNCKKIRDDRGYWNLIESYIERHSDALFSHSMCPACTEKLYGTDDWFKKKKDTNN